MDGLSRLDSFESVEQWERYQQICITPKRTQGRSLPQKRVQIREKSNSCLELERQVLEVIEEKDGVTSSEIAIALQSLKIGQRKVQGILLSLVNKDKVSKSRKRAGQPWTYYSKKHANQSFSTTNSSTPMRGE